MQRAALFIGINNYNEPLTPLACAIEDASELYQRFLPEYTPGLVHFLSDPDSDEIIEKIEYLIDRLDKEDLFLIYFSGHGIELHNNHYLLSSKAKCLGGHWRHSVPMDMLKAITQKTGVQTVFILDSCRKNAFTGSRDAGAESATRGVTMKKLVENVEQGFLPPIVFCSCSGGQMAFEVKDKQHGIFTLALLDTLKDTASATLDEITRTVTEKMENLIKEYQFTGLQTPELIKTPLANPVLWGSPEKQTSKKSKIKTSQEAEKTNKPVNRQKLSTKDRKAYFALLDQLEAEVKNTPVFRDKLAEIKTDFELYDQKSAYSALLKIQEKVAYTKAVESYKKRYKTLQNSCPEDAAADFPEEAKKFRISLNVAESLFADKNITEALKILDESDAILENLLSLARKKRARKEKREKELNTQRKREEIWIKLEEKRKKIEELKEQLSQLKNEFSTATQSSLNSFYNTYIHCEASTESLKEAEEVESLLLDELDITKKIKNKKHFITLIITCIAFAIIYPIVQKLHLFDFMNDIAKFFIIPTVTAWIFDSVIFIPILLSARDLNGAVESSYGKTCFGPILLAFSCVIIYCYDLSGQFWGGLFFGAIWGGLYFIPLIRYTLIYASYGITKLALFLIEKYKAVKELMK